MEPEKSRDDNIPSPFEKSDGHRLTDKRNEASQSSHAHTDSASKYSMENVYGTVQSFTEDPAICKNGSDFMGFGTLQSSQVLGDGLRNKDLCDTEYQNPRVSVNYIPSECTVGSFEMNAQERVASRNWSQTAASSGASVLNSTIAVVPSNDFNIEAFHPSNLDGNFLALGLGGDAGYREEMFSSREFPCTVSPQNNSSYVQPDTNLYVQPASNSYVLPASTNSNPNQKSTQDFLGFQRSPGAFPRPTFNPGSWTTHYNDEESATVNWDNLGLVQNSYPYPYPFYSPSHAAPGHHFFGDVAFAANSPGIIPTMTVPAGYQGSPAPRSLPFNSFNTNYPHPGFASYHHDLASESAKPIWTHLSPPTYRQQNFDNKKDSGVPFYNHPTGQRGGSATHDYLGVPTLPMKGFSSHALESIPPSLGVHSFGPTPTIRLNPPHGVWNSTSPDMFELQNGKHHAIKPIKSGPLPSIQLDNPSQVNQEIPILRQAGPQTKNNVIQDQACKPPYNARAYVRPTSGSDPQHIILPPPNAPRPLYTGPGPSSLQVHKQPQTSSYSMSKPSLKRRAADPPKVPSWGRRKKYMHVPPHSTNNGTQGVAVTQSPPPAASYVAYIKSLENAESPPKLAGWDCLICKLDLSFSPDNPEHQPTIRPAVAVLSCGHTFHDQCLKLITPADQAKDPPCIPCAMGEN